ncbi:MAG: acyltransferase family protein [Lautropia sp.]
MKIYRPIAGGQPAELAQTATPRLESIQALRGIAALLVVFNHAALIADSIQRPGWNSWLVPTTAVAEMGAIGVDLFFIISGFVMALTASRFSGIWGASTFLALRFVRIAPLFYLATLLMVVNLFRADLPLDPSGLLNSLTFIPIFDDADYSWPLHYLGWTLSFEFSFYVLVALLIVFGCGARPYRLLVVMILAPAAGYLLRADSAAWKIFTNPLMWEFALGVIACILWQRRRMRALRTPCTILAIVSIAALAAALYVGKAALQPLHLDVAIGNASDGGGTVDGSTSPTRVLFWGIPMFLLFCATAGYADLGGSVVAKLLKHLGDASYSIYLSHLFVIMVVDALVERVYVHPDLVVVAVLPISGIVGWLVHRTVEKPLLVRGQRRVRQWTVQHTPSGT